MAKGLRCTPLLWIQPYLLGKYKQLPHCHTQAEKVSFEVLSHFDCLYTKGTKIFSVKRGNGYWATYLPIYLLQYYAEEIIATESENKFFICAIKVRKT